MKIKVVNKIKNLSTEPLLNMYVEEIRHNLKYIDTEGYNDHECIVTLKLINHRPVREVESCCEMHRGAIEYALSDNAEVERRKLGIKPLRET